MFSVNMMVVLPVNDKNAKIGSKIVKRVFWSAVGTEIDNNSEIIWTLSMYCSDDKVFGSKLLFPYRSGVMPSISGNIFEFSKLVDTFIQKVPETYPWLPIPGDGWLDSLFKVEQSYLESKDE